VVRGYALWGSVVVLAASLLPGLAERLAEETGLGASFVGTALVGATTSLPEVVVTLSAARLGAFDKKSFRSLPSSKSTHLAKRLSERPRL
jgi:cation:H+ antiporter